MTKPLLFLLLAALPTGIAAAPAPMPAGTWMWDNGEAAVEFHPCGAALCARIIWVKAESAPGAGPLLDTRNPDPALRKRRVCGLDYITGVTRSGNDGWKHGRVYDFHGGSSYDLDIDTVGDAEVSMRGYKGMRMLGATLRLVRPVPAGLACTPAS